MTAWDSWESLRLAMQMRWSWITFGIIAGLFVAFLAGRKYDEWMTYEQWRRRR